jgi:hypothetical protein
LGNEVVCPSRYYVVRGGNMRVLVGCEESQVVVAEFLALGHEAWSCDEFYSGRKGLPHYQCDIREVLCLGWDLAIFHTPCTRLANSGVRWLDERNLWKEMREDAELFCDCMNAPIPMIGMENPVPHRYALEIIGRKYDQIVQPYMFGHPESKKTCLWLKGLPKLVETNNVKEEMMNLPKNQAQRIHHMPPSLGRQRERSVTYRGLAQAMAAQWGGV